MRATLVDRGNRKEISIKRSAAEINKERDLVGWYENPKLRQGVLFGRIVMSGDRMDGWASHVYHIALKPRGKGFTILGWLHCTYGWHGTYSVEKPKEWKLRMIALV
ncbi:MAG: hypothetical protein ACRD2L_23760, partial [Terriglobia bacterium]